MSSEQLPEEKNGDWVDLKKEDLSCTLPTHPSTVTPSTLTENSTEEENTESLEEEATEKSTEEENSNLPTLFTEETTIENLKIAEKTPLTPPKEPTESTPVEPSDAVVSATVKTEEQTLEKGEEKIAPATLTEEQTLEVKDIEDVPATNLLRERRTKDSAETSTTAENIDDEESTPRTTPQANPVDKVANFFLTPGITSSAVVIMNASFAGLFLSLFVLLVLTHSYHVVFLIFTTAGLFISTHWFMMELKAAKAREAISIASETSAREVSAIMERTEEQIQSESTLNVNETRAKQA